MQKVIYRLNVIETQCNTHPEHPTLEEKLFDYEAKIDTDVIEILQALTRDATRCEKWGDKTYRILSLEILKKDEENE